MVHFVAGRGNVCVDSNGKPARIFRDFKRRHKLYSLSGGVTII